ncbi:unnamed protein product [Danaus chrysippus]|uniref:(African queen) hypothetical protein n=1 Tax=Danaus chrysippus TaxID=151541 RepID=A0A8J2R3S5_9NEOP|nr:unnamed protein product [Danaus chrysippus]
MDGIIKIIAAFAKLTLAILEGVLKAVLVTFFSLTLVGSVAACGVIIGAYLIKYGCNTDSCEVHRTVGGAMVVAGWMVAVYMVIKTIRGFFC